MSAPVRKAVIPAAGRGTRFLPASKAIPKEMIPVVDRPSIQYVVEEAVAAGLEDVCIITAVGKEAVERHFAPAPELEQALAAKGDAARLTSVRQASTLASMTYVIQDEAKGLGHAIGCAEQWVGSEPFAVLLGDDFLDERDYLLGAMCAIQERTGGSVVLLLEVPERMVSMYGIVDAQRVDISGPAVPPDLEVYKVDRLHEKPAVKDAYSNLAIIGRYVLHPAVFDVLRNTPPGRGGEIQITDAINTLASMPRDEGGGVYGVVFRGRRYDTGDKLEYLKAVVQLGQDHPDVGADFSAWLTDHVSR